ncbi:MAG: class I SAM-dependent methyltransferase, partial [Nitrososphaerales archaeon]
DVGCGNDGFLAFIQERGWDAYGLDNSPAGVNIAKELLGDRVLLTTLKEASYPSNHFDVVCLFEVLEHLPDPCSDLKEINRILKPAGLLCLSVPNFASWERFLFGKWWNGLDAPRHLYQFIPRTLRQLMTLADFTILELKSANACHIQLNRTYIDYCRESLRFFLRDIGLYPQKEVEMDQGLKSTNLLKGKAWWKRGFNLIENIFLYPFWLFNRITDRDNTLWACGQKREQT